MTVYLGYPDAPARSALAADCRRAPRPLTSRPGRGPAPRDLIARHRVLVHCVIDPSPDEHLPGSGVVAAAEAARATLPDRGPAHRGFALFHAPLPLNPGPEAAAGFTSGHLPAPAARVPGLRSAAFDAEVRTLYWKPWVDAGQRLYDTAGAHHGTPSMLRGVGGVDLRAHPELLDDPSVLQRYVENAANRGE